MTITLDTHPYALPDVVRGRKRSYLREILRLLSEVFRGANDGSMCE